MNTHFDDDELGDSRDGEGKFRLPDDEYEDTGVCANCWEAPDCDYASENAPRCWKKNR